MGLMTRMEPERVQINPEDVVARVSAALAEQELSQSAASAKIGVSASALNQYLKGVYKGDVAGVEAKCRRWLESLGDRARARAGRLEEPAFQDTPTARRIGQLLHLAQHAPTMVVVAGVPGTGKTSAALDYAARNPNVWVATMDVQTCSPAMMMGEILAAAGGTIRSAQLVRRQLEDRMRGSDGLIVIDEVQHLSRKGLDMLRGLHDRLEIGVAMLGNHGLYAGTSTNSRTDGFAQFYSRVGARMRIEGPTKADIEVMLDAWGIRDAAAREFLQRIAAKLGALRGLKMVLNQAAAIAAADREAVGAHHMKAAWASLNQFDG